MTFTKGKLHCVVFIWFKVFDEFLTDGQYMAHVKYILLQIYLIFWIYYGLACPGDHVDALTKFTYPGRWKSFPQFVYYGEKYI
jgi:hypothetical protein